MSKLITLDNLRTFKAKLSLSAYPVGSIYMSINNNPSPASLFGGDWEQLQDVFLLAAGTTYTAGSAGGSADAIVVQHQHVQVAQTPNYPAVAYAYNKDLASETTVAYGAKYSMEDTLSNAKGKYVYAQTEQTGVNGAGKNMPPYLTVYMWKRIS